MKKFEKHQFYSKLLCVILKNLKFPTFYFYFQDSIEKTLEETSRDNIFTLTVVRHRATFGKVSVDWTAEGNINDITPVTGKVSQTER